MIDKFDLTGKKFGYWTVIGKDETIHNSQNTRWICKCECGTVRSILRFTLVNGRSQSCGCRVSEKRKGINKTHGMSKTRLYHEWLSMRRRCKNPNDKSADSYYNKGITVCDEWNDSFESFSLWALANGYNDRLTIDRIDNEKGYTPDNCRWITNEEQQRNRTNTVVILYNGEKWCLRTLFIALGFPYKLAHQRYTRAMKANKPITTEMLFAPIINRNFIP